MYGFDKDFATDDVVWFYGKRAVVGGHPAATRDWMVPIVIGDSFYVTIAHCADLSREKPEKKKKPKHYETVDVELTPELKEFMLQELCRRDIRPSKWLKDVVFRYIENLGIGDREVSE